MDKYVMQTVTTKNMDTSVVTTYVIGIYLAIVSNGSQPMMVWSNVNGTLITSLLEPMKFIQKDFYDLVMSETTGALSTDDYTRLYKQHISDLAEKIEKLNNG